VKKLSVILIVIGLLLVVVGCPPSYEPGGLILPEDNEITEGDGIDATLPAVPIGAPPDDMNWISPGKVNVANYYPGAMGAKYPTTVHNGWDDSTGFTVTYRHPDHMGDGYSKPIDKVQEWIIVADMTPLLMPKETRDILITLDMPEDVSKWAVPVWNLTEAGKEVKLELQKEYKRLVELAIETEQPWPEKCLALVFLENINGKEVDKISIPQEYKDFVIPTDENNWEFWISVMDMSQGQVKAELCVRWLITMR